MTAAMPMQRYLGQVSMAVTELGSGNKMPSLGLATWQLTNDTAATIVRAIELGYRMIDTSGDYGTQPGIGEGLRRSGVRRDSVYLVTKVEETDDAYLATCRCLEELGLGYADLMLVHRPPHFEAGERLWSGLIRARGEGLARDIGVSNYSTKQIDVLIEKTGEVPAVDQIPWSPYGFSEDMLRYAREKRIVIQAYSPLTRGKRLKESTLARIASQYGRSPAQILIQWNLRRGTVPLPKANRFDHLEEDIDVFDFLIEDGDMAKLDRLNEGYSPLGRLPYS